MNKKLYTLVVLCVYCLNINFSNAQCVTAASATFTYVSSSGGNCTYNAVFSATVGQNSVKLISFNLPAGSSPASVCYGSPLSGTTLTQVACSGGSYSNIGSSGTFSGPSISVTMPCTASATDLTASNNTNGTGDCSGTTAVTTTGANPVKLSYFKGYSENNQIHLQWQTEAETNSSYFMVQRSTDAKEFSDLEMIKATGESTQKVIYDYIDKSPSQGINYYRLRQVDNDGSFTFSKIIDIKQNGASELMVFPNPSVGNLTLKGLSDVVSYEAYAINGKKVEVKLEKSGADYQVVFTENQAKGVYLLKLKTIEKSYNYRLVLE